MPYKDKSKPEIKCRKIVIEKARWDMFDQAKIIAEKELGLMGNGTFLELLIVNFLEENRYNEELKNEYRFNKKNNPKSK